MQRKASISAQGQLNPIWIYDDKIIDGRNRFNACSDLGIEVISKVWDGEGSLVEFVLGLNLHRRQLTVSQRAIVSLNILPMLEIEAKEAQRLSGIEYGRGIEKVRTKTSEPIQPRPAQAKSVEQAVSLWVSALQ